MKPEPTFAEKVASVDTLAELEGMKYGVKFEAERLGIPICEKKMALIATRRVEIQRERGAR